MSRELPGPGPRSIIRSASQMVASVLGNLRRATALSISTVTSFPVCRKASPAEIYGGQQQIAALALSWYPNDWLRFMLQFQYVDVNRLNSAGTVQIGQRFETLAARAQASW
jgi:hypothetical protein